MPYWQNKVAMVTGGSAGLGFVLSQTLARRGANVALVARDPVKLQSAVDRINALNVGKALGVAVDITQQAGVELAVRQTLARFGQLNALFNNAGRSSRGNLLSVSAEELQSQFDLNVVALARMTQAAAPSLIASRGHVINIGSLAAKSASCFLGAYATTKHAVAGYSQQLRLENSATGLHVLLVCPGPIARDEPRDYEAPTTDDLPESARKPGAGVKLNRIDPTWLAEKILRACELRSPELVVPAKARLLFAMSSLWPRLGDWLVMKMTR